MRLTLRTLLAYRDGVLDPKDAAVLEAKIKESSTAQRIAQRITDEMRNRRLAPIPVDAREFGFEANLVAEYLDDTIHTETLPEMERKCLENNTLLSEIGSCHQILSRALSIPAPVTASLRQRIRELPNTAKGRSSQNRKMRRIDPAANLVTSADGAVNGKPVVMAASTKTIRKPNGELRGSGIELNDGLGRQVPEYLIGSDRSWIATGVLTVGLLLALVVAGALAIGPTERLGRLLRKSEAIAALAPKADETKKLAPPPAIQQEETGKKEDSAATDKTDDPLATGGMPVGLDAASTTIAPSSLDKSSLSDSVPRPSLAAPTSIESVSVPATPFKNRMQWLPNNKDSAAAVVLRTSAATPAVQPAWKRLSSGAFIEAGDRVIVPPAQRTEMRLEPGIQLLCAGENDLEMPSTSTKAKLRVSSGRMLLFATPDANAVELDCNGLLLAIRFKTNDGSCALEVRNTWSKTSDEMLDAGKFNIENGVSLTAVQGEIEFQSISSDQQTGVRGEVAPTATVGTLMVGQFIDWKQGLASKKQDLVEAPVWFRTSIERPIDKMAAIDLQRGLVGNESSDLEKELADLSKHRRSETAALGARVRMMLGEYDQLFEADGILNRKGMHSHWLSLLYQLPQSLGRPESRLAFENALRFTAPGRDLTLLGLLIPKSNEQLGQGGDKLLVEVLSSAMLDERVLAIHQLTLITGKTLGYQADKGQVESVQQWRKLLSRNEIRYQDLTQQQKMEPSR